MNKKKCWRERWFAATIWNYWIISLYWYFNFKKYANFTQPGNGRFLFKTTIVSVRGFKALLSLLYINPMWGVVQSSDAEQSVLSLLSRYKIFAALHSFYLLLWKALAAFHFMQEFLLFLWSVCTLDSPRRTGCLRLFEQIPLWGCVWMCTKLFWR